MCVWPDNCMRVGLVGSGSVGEDGWGRQAWRVRSTSGKSGRGAKKVLMVSPYGAFS
ncbi:hypothetical protein ASPTUDRAFT_45719 [Aspergillus tubingensis CBS 134.48]|uniref:Uncharacterized protein n=1 Tax=Aspergillus tubingensis (strain CBS 134.48) TaxID=767770 RepID=A0A1L9MZ54_ASPTC|nr:hypothetical protein ASPTUDRAFT_45719 [Aspergillus tubingensis CBS 134.48]